MSEFSNMLFALLRSALDVEELDNIKLAGVDENYFEKLYLISKKHDIAHLISVALDRSGVIINEEIAKKFTKQQMLAIHRYENIEYELNRIYSVLQEAEIPHIPLKGSVIRHLYPEPWMRTSCDIDVLVHDFDIEKATKILAERLGYRVDDKIDYHNISLRSANGVHLELHFNIKEGVDLLDRNLEKVWDYSSPIEPGSFRYVLTNEFFVYHIVAHASYHFIKGGCGIRPFIDLWTINKKFPYDREKLLLLCEDSQIDRFLSVSEKLSDVWLSGSEHDDLSAQMERYLLEGGAFGTMESSIAARHGVRGGRVGYANSRIFTSFENLKARYPSMKSRALMPIYQVRRWFDVLRENRLNRSVKELKINASIDNEKVVRVGRLMNDLELNNLIK